MAENGGQSIGRHINRLRKGVHMTQAELAAAAGVSLDLIRKLEQEVRYTASIASLHKIARALDVETGELLSKAAPLPRPTEHSGVVALRRVLTGVDDLLGEQGAELDPVSVSDVERTAAGRHGRGDVAEGLLVEAGDIARHTGHRNDHEVAFGPDQVPMQTVDVQVVTEAYGLALKTARRLPRSTPLPLAARARHLSDQALAHARLGQDGAAIDTLSAMARLAPVWARYQMQPRMVYQELRGRQRRAVAIDRSVRHHRRSEPVGDAAVA